MYKLFYFPRNASWAPHLVLEELGVKYELVLVDRNTNGQKDEGYMALNPTGRIPTLIDDDLVIFESAAICLYLCEQHPQTRLLPKIGDPNRVKFHQWLFYLTTTLQPELMIYIYPGKHTTDKSAEESIVEAQNKRIHDIFSLLNNELENNEYLIGDNVTVCDYYLFMLSYWANIRLAKSPLSYEYLGRYLRGLAKQQTIINVCAVEKLSLLDYK